MQRKIMTSVKLQKSLNFKLQQRIISDGYGMRGKSLWITEAIENFLQLPDYPALVDIAGEMANQSEILSIRLSENLANDMEKAVVKIRRQYPAMEGVKSNLVRASIMQRLIRKPASVAE
ncbi:MAG: hypothetical protein SFW66_01410 [Gammaproteobacteria bacterium]|nr:hypothetical protein [Gammaproteobacteria bacterium]